MFKTAVTASQKKWSYEFFTTMLCK